MMPAMTSAVTLETTDAPWTLATPYTIGVNDQFSGSISSNSDQDLVRLTVTAGQTLQFDAAATSGSALDPNFFVFDAAGNQVTYDDNSGPGNASRATLTFAEAGSYYLGVTSSGGVSSGNYTLSVSNGVALPEYTIDQIAAQLTDGFWNSFSLVNRSFAVAPGGTLNVDISALTADGQALATTALEAWTFVSGINFNTVTSGAQITFDDNAAGAYSTSIVSGNTITSSFVNVSTAWLGTYGTTLDTYSFQTYIHEIGHAIGLGHGGNYNGAAAYGVDNHYINDSWQASIMSYMAQSQNTSIAASLAFIVTPMIADIVAIQNLYGTATDLRVRDTVYGENSTAGGYYDGLTSLSTGVAMTLIDSGGTDLLDFRSAVADQRIDLNAEAISSIGGLTGNLIIARDTMIENAYSGSGNDTLIGNAGANTLMGGGGTDSLTLGDGADIWMDTIANIFGDTVVDFTEDDTIVFSDLAVNQREVTTGTGNVSIGIDTNNDRSVDGTFTLTGDFSSGTFLAIKTGSQTTVTFETFLPTLTEMSAISGTANGITNELFLTGNGVANYRVTLQNTAFSSFDNTLGVYEIDATGAIVDARLVVTDTNADKSATATITGVDAGNMLGFFLVQDGATWASGLGGAALSFVNASNAAANISDGNTIVLAEDGIANSETIYHAYASGLNADGQVHAISGINAAGDGMYLGFEDMTNGGDMDYQDVLFLVDLIEFP